MTMQTTTLPFQVSGASPLAQPQPQLQRSAAAGVQAPEAGQFSATLSRAMAPTMAPSPAPASKPAAPAKQADKPAAPAPKTAAREPARQNEAASDAPATADSAAAGSTEPGDAAKDAAAAESATAAAEAATTPVTDMLAFMASLMRPAAQAAATPVAAEAAAATAAGSAAMQLAALQSAFAKLGTADGAAAAADPALAAGLEGDAAGFSLAAGVQPTAQESADLRTLQQAAQAAVPADPGKAQPQVREALANAAASVEAPLPSATQLQAQAAKLDTLQNPAAVPTDRIPARLGTQAWDNQVSQRIIYMVGKEQAATLTLNPPDLGPVQVVLNVSNDGASVAFSSNQQEVRQALENALPRLREMMGENGIALGNATVDAGMPDGRQAQQDGGRRDGGGGGFGNVGGTLATSDDGAARPATRTVSLGDNGLVDTFA